MDRVLGSLRRFAGGAVLLALTFVPASANPDPGPDPGPGLQGAAVPEPAGADAHPALATGRYLDRLPGKEAHTYELPRTATGSTFHVAAMFIGAGNSIGEGLRLSIGTTPGSSGCGSAGVFRPTAGEPAPLMFASVSTWTDTSEHPCAAATNLYLSIDPPSDAADIDRRVELLVYEEPALSSYAFGLLSAPQTPTWTALTPGAPKPLAAGTTPENAPVVGPGTHRIRIAPGGTSVLAIPLDWDQSLQAQLDARLPDGVTTGEISVNIVGPLLGTSQVVLDPSAIDGWTQGPPPSGGRLRTGALSQVVSYVHRDSLDRAVNTETLAGLHFVVITWTGPDGPDGPDDAAVPVPARVTLQVKGTPGEGIPDYPKIDGLASPQADSRLVVPAPPGGVERPVETPASEERRPEDSGSATGILVLIGVGAVACVALVVAIRRAARARAR